MIVYTIILIAAAVIVVLLSILATVAILDSNRQARYYEMARQDLEAALAGKIALKEENGRLQDEWHYAQAQNTDLSEALESTRKIYNKMLVENTALKARNADLEEAIEAKPTQTKRTVRKNGAQASTEEA